MTVHLPHDSTHPVWATIRIVAMMICLTVVLAIQAESFDNTELRTLGWMFGIGVLGEGGVGFVMRKLGGGK